jgi:glutathione synthase/RimK-type ligase-like ATP-grasp enzyme
MYMYDIIVLTQKEYIDPPNPDWYVKQVLTEDEYVLNALKKKGLNVYRTNWDNPDFNRYETKLILFRTIWDYFHRFGEFSAWLNDVKNKAILINPAETIYWNIDKHYLKDLEKKGIPIPPTEFAEIGDTRNLHEFFEDCAWKEAVLKPAVSGAGRHTYKINRKNLQNYNAVFKELVKTEAMMLQEYQKNITVFGETACMVFNGKFSHAVLKKAKTGEFRVQDDFGGSVYHYTASREEIELAEKVTSLIQPVPVYSRVDMIKDNLGNWAVGELELIEPELWFRFYPPAADLLADALCRVVSA